MTHDDSDTGRMRPAASDDNDLLREMLDLVDERVSRISDEEVEARLHLVLARVNGAATAAGSVSPTPEELHRYDPAMVEAHLEAIRIVEAARREADARRREAYYAERHFAELKNQAEKALEAACANAEIIKNHALTIIEQARERANWILENAQRGRERAGHEKELSLAGSPRCSRNNRAPRVYYDVGPGSPARNAVALTQAGEPRTTPPESNQHDGRRTWKRRYLRALVAVDAAAGLVAAVLSSLGGFAEVTGYLTLSLAVPVVWVAAVALATGYEARILGLGSEEYQRVFRAFIGLTATAGFVSYALKAEVARGYVVLALPLAMMLSFLGHYALRQHLHRARSRGHNTFRVIVVGDEDSVADLAIRLGQERYCGMQVVGACLSTGDGARIVGLGIPLLGGLDDVNEAARSSRADTVAVAAGVGPARLRRLSWQLERTEIDLLVAPGLIDVAGPRLRIRPVTGLPLVHVEEPEFAGARRVLKGAVDRVLAGVGFVLLLPLLVAIGLAVRLTSSGPALFKQVRIGQGGREFTLLKFRSMYADAEARRAELLTRNERAEGLLFKIRDDPRITPVGRWLRRFSLDELPQLVNVLAGRMSLVGPRPPLPEEVALYQDDVRRRLLVKPGLTGLWQISGRRDLDWDESVRLDLRYVENWSFTLDLMILWKTFSTVIRGHGAY